MTPSKMDLVIAKRFGLGIRPEAATGERPDVRRLISDEIARGAHLPAVDGLLDTPATIDLVTKLKRAKASSISDMGRADEEQNPVVPTLAPNEIYRREAAVHFEAASSSRLGFAERIVWFWTNHFSVATGKSMLLKALAGVFEREVIRRHAFGRFSDLLIAAETHPAMLLYLDNQSSTGPASPTGARRGAGLNENLAREILELHTLGVHGGYSQSDVTSFAKVISGWTVGGLTTSKKSTVPSGFIFDVRRHEPGPQTILGKIYARPGIEQGLAILVDLAAHRSTARFIATKLARYFVADHPPESLIRELEQVFLETGGDLRHVYTALAASAAAITPPFDGIIGQEEFVVSCCRAFDVAPSTPLLLRYLMELGHPLWNPPGPNGFSSNADQLATPQGLKNRLVIASRLARSSRRNVRPDILLGEVAGQPVSDETREAVMLAESREQAFALIAMSPEFQRR